MLEFFSIVLLVLLNLLSFMINYLHFTLYSLLFIACVSSEVSLPFFLQMKSA